MQFFRNFKYKLFIATVIGILSSFYQLESKDELHVAEKSVMLSKSRQETCDFVANLENYPTWFPNIIKIKSADSNKQVTIGKRYKMTNTYLFGIGESQFQLTVIGYQKPSLFEYLCDNVLMERNRLEFKSVDKNKTLLKWNIYSRRKSLLFKYTVGALYQFYYSQLLREALFSLQFSIKN